MNSTLKKVAQGLLLVPVLALGLSVFSPVTDTASAAFTAPINQGLQASQSSEVPTDLFGQTGIFRLIVNILLFIIAAISVIMLIIGGVRYVVSGGDQSAVTSAKNTILYAIVGIVVAVLAFAAVNFVFGSLLTTGNPVV